MTTDSSLEIEATLAEAALATLDRSLSDREVAAAKHCVRDWIGCTIAEPLHHRRRLSPTLSVTSSEPAAPSSSVARPSPRRASPR